MLKISIEGIEQLSQELNSLGSSVGGCLEDAVMAGGMMLQEQGQANSPYKSGTLKSSIATDAKRTGKTSVEGTVGPRNVAYARIQEFGGMTGRGHKTRITGKFYMTNALNQKGADAKHEMERVIREGFNR